MAGELLFEFNAAIQVRAKSLEEAEKLADEYLTTTPEGARVIRVDTDSYPMVFSLDEEGEIEDEVPEHEIPEKAS